MKTRQWGLGKGMLTTGDKDGVGWGWGKGGVLATQDEDNGGGIRGRGGWKLLLFLTAYSLLKNTLVLHVGVGAVLWLVVFSSHGLCMIMRPSTGLPFTNEAFHSNPESVHSSPESDRIRPACLWQSWVRHKKQGGYEGDSKRRLWN